MAKNKNKENPNKVAKKMKTPKTKKKFTKMSTNIKQAKAINRFPNKQNLVKNNIGNERVTNNDSVLELMTTYPDLNQTFEYILYSNKYKHTLTDVFNIIKMLMSKLEELQKNDVDLNNIFETINVNNKIKCLVQSTAINLTHVVEQLNVNESKFINFAKHFISPLKVSNDFDNPVETIEPSLTSVPMVSEESKVLGPDTCLSKKLKTKHLTDKSSTDIFNCKYTIVLSDDEYEEYYDENKKQRESEPIKKEYLESYVIGSEFTDILSEHSNSSYDVIPSPIQNQDNIIPKWSSQRVQRVKKIKQKIPDIAVNEARRSDFQLRKRLNERNNDMLNIVNKLDLQPLDIVLEFDILNKKPLITIHKQLAKILKKHQVEGVRFLWNTVFETVKKSNTTDGTGCILAHRMGIGKSLQIITLIYTILCNIQINIKTFLIICPPGIIYNWMDEIYKWLKDIDKNEVVKVYDLPKTNKLYNITNIATWQSKGGILILSYENFKSLVNCKQSDLREAFSHTLVDPGPDVVILDEGHYIKNTNTVLLKCLTRIRTKRRIVLTGTPIQNSLKEYYTMVDFVKPNILGNFSDFSSTFIKPIDSGQFIDSSNESVQIMKQRTFILHKLLQNTVHRIDDKNLKPLFTDKIEYTVEVNMTPFQCELYEKFLNYIKMSNDSCSVFLRLHVLTLITLHPLTLHSLLHCKNSKQPEFGTITFDDKLVKDLSWIADYGEDMRFFEANQSNKMMYLLSTIEKCRKRNEKVLCFLKSPLALDAVEYFLQKEKNWTLGENYFRMDGKTPLSIRNQMCEAFNNPQNPSRLFILSLGTGVLGYNMVGANRVLLLSTSWNPSNDLQAIYRCLRFGQKKIVYVNRLLAKGTVEPKAYYRQISKLGMASSVVDLQHLSRKVSYEQTNDLFTFDSSKQHFTLVPNTKDPVLNELIRCHIGSISDLKEHDSMLVESVEDQLTMKERIDIWLSFKNNKLGINNVITPKPLCKLQSNKQSKIKNQQQNMNEDIKQELDLNSQSKKHQVSIQDANESCGSNSHIRFNNPKLSISSSCSGKFNKCTNAAVAKNSTALNTELKNTNLADKQHNYWKIDNPIQNQFKNFQNKNFNHHKINSAQNRFNPKRNLKNTFDKNEDNSVDHVNRSWYGNQRTITENNIKNRSGMSR